MNMVNFDCDIRGETLVGKRELKIHCGIHTGGKPFHCLECDGDDPPLQFTLKFT